MVWYFRVVEADDGSLICRRGIEVLDRHGTLEEAVAHASELAAVSVPAQVVVHHRDGTVVRMRPILS